MNRFAIGFCAPLAGRGAAFREMPGTDAASGCTHSFFELAGNLPVEVAFAITEENCRKLLELLTRERLSLFYIKSPCEFGHIGDE